MENSQRPDGYIGCGSNNLHNSSIPQSISSLTKLQELNLEYTCTAGNLDVLTSNTAMEELSLHGNYITGTIPQEFNR